MKYGKKKRKDLFRFADGNTAQAIMVNRITKPGKYGFRLHFLANIFIG
jgi:hypothetical protein